MPDDDGISRFGDASFCGWCDAWIKPDTAVNRQWHRENCGPRWRGDPARPVRKTPSSTLQGGVVLTELPPLEGNGR